MKSIGTILSDLGKPIKLTEPHSLMERQKNNDYAILKQNYETAQNNKGINALDLIESDPLSTSTFAKAIAVLQSNYGMEFSEEKTITLYNLLKTEGWTEERFTRTLKWFLKNKKYPSWNIADWFEYEIRLYPRSWMLRKIHEGADPKVDLECYEIKPKIFGWKFRDGEILPFKLREDLCGRKEVGT